MTGYLPWQQAWQQALYGEHGFYRRPAGPAAHFRTSVHVGDALARALAELAGRCGLRRVVDVGAGRGELLTALRALDGDLELVGIDVVPPPSALGPGVGWLVSPGGVLLADGLRPWLSDALVVAHEWLDDLPCPVVRYDAPHPVSKHGAGWRLLEVAPDGTERPGPPAPADQQRWLHRWWPGAGAGDRAEVGLPRDEAWASLVTQAPGSVLLAVDYAHHRWQRPPGGTLLGYRDGRSCPPLPDGSCDLTAHVALDAVAAAGQDAGAQQSTLVTQRSALRALGVRATLPDARAAATDPRAYLAALTLASQHGELLDPAGLGGFGWLLQSTGPRLPRLGDPASAPAAAHELDTPASDGQG